MARGGNDLAQRREAALQLGADLPVRAEQQDPQGAYTGSRSAATSASSGARASVSYSSGSATAQPMASVGSFQPLTASAPPSVVSVYWRAKVALPLNSAKSDGLRE